MGPGRSGTVPRYAARRRVMADTQIPDPERHWFYLRCPVCRARIWNQLFTTMLAYRVHYLEHVAESLEDHVEVLAKGGDPRPWDGYMHGVILNLLKREEGS